MKGSYTRDVEQHAEWELEKHASFYLIPNWLRDALDANGVTEDCLTDAEKLKTILTVEDVKFYNSQAEEFYKIKKRINFLDDIYPTYLYGIFPNEQRYADPGLVGEGNDELLYENTVSIKDAISPFISTMEYDAKANVLSALYPIFKFSNNRDKVFITFGLADPATITDKTQESYESLATFLISEHGIKNVACSEVFKKILENKRNY